MRPDHDPAGFGLFGVSRGGGTALVVAARRTRRLGRDHRRRIPDPRHDASPTSFAGPRSYVAEPASSGKLSRRGFSAVSAGPAAGSPGGGCSCRFPDVEAAAARLSPRPWLMIHGAKDAYIGPEIAQGLFDRGRNRKSSGSCPEAKHNRCREVDPARLRFQGGSLPRAIRPRRPMAGRGPGDSAVVPVTGRVSADRVHECR